MIKNISISPDQTLSEIFGVGRWVYLFFHELGHD